MRLKFYSVVASGLLVLGIIFAFVFVTTLQQWARPTLPMLLMALGLLGFLLVYSIFWYRISSEETGRAVGAGGESAEERSFKRLVGLVLQASLGILLLFACALWNLEVVRLAAVDLVSGNRYVLENALTDRSDMVLREACVAIFATASAYESQRALQAALHHKPSVAYSCLSMVVERKPDLQPRVSELGRNLLRGWNSELLASDGATADRNCQIAPWLYAMESLADARDMESLMRCSMTIEEPRMRQCCSEALAELGPIEDWSGEPAEASRRWTPAELTTLVAISFRPLDQPESLQKSFAQMSLDQNSSRRFAVDVACQMMRDPVQERPTIGALTPLVDSPLCELSSEARVRMGTAEAWQYICQELEGVPGDEAVEAAVCRIYRNNLVGLAAGRASERVYLATRQREMTEAADFVSRNLASQAMTAEPAFDIDGYTFGQLRQGRSGRQGPSIHASRHCQVVDVGISDLGRMTNLAHGIHRPSMPQVIETTNCQPTGTLTNMTVGELRSARHATANRTRSSRSNEQSLEDRFSPRVLQRARQEMAREIREEAGQ